MTFKILQDDRSHKIHYCCRKIFEEKNLQNRIWPEFWRSPYRRSWTDVLSCFKRLSLLLRFWNHTWKMFLSLYSCCHLWKSIPRWSKKNMKKKLIIYRFTWITLMDSPVSCDNFSLIWRVGFGAAKKAAFKMSSCLAWKFFLYILL